ncbi:hypothetical protein [Frankia sp. EI5c]|uniref:hypothetical protein n=1 Tax=Frankia sp. EI5c TaxID=683316 RepID=UPI0018FF04D8|nr:hypothetical protein [Frankia sp. EI5c]
MHATIAAAVCWTHPHEQRRRHEGGRATVIAVVHPVAVRRRTGGRTSLSLA